MDLLPDIDAVEMLLENSGRNKRSETFLSRFLPESFARDFACQCR